VTATELSAGEARDLGGADIDLQQPPDWRSAEELIAEDADIGSGDDGAPGLPPGDPVLRREVAMLCADRPQRITERSLLRGVVADMDAQGMPPDLVVDALIVGRCGDLADIVTEVVARGGEAAALPVMERAIALAGRASRLVVERAAAQGLVLAGRVRVADSGGTPALAGAGDDYTMLYFPLGGGVDVSDTVGVNLAQLLGNAEPGYGIYTYILYGGQGDAERLASYRELLRVIETYVLAAGAERVRPDPGAHTFLVPVYASRAGTTLLERTGPELAVAMRDELAAALRRRGEDALAMRLATAPGPFLVSSLEPRLVPGGAQAPRLLVDLSSIGPEYMYSVVDAYDREIPPDAAGRVDSLLAVRGRLIGLVGERRVDPDALPGGSDWVFLLGQRATAESVPGSARRAVQNRG
jgi:hypothetical protein